MTPINSDTNNSEPLIKEESGEMDLEDVEVLEKVNRLVDAGTRVPLPLAKCALQRLARDFSVNIKSAQGRQFVENSMRNVLSGLLDKDNPYNHDAVQESLESAAEILAKCMRADRDQSDDGDKLFIEMLAMILHRVSPLYQDAKGKMTRFIVMDVFQREDGFVRLAEYLASWPHQLQPHSLLSLKCLACTLLDLIIVATDKEALGDRIYMSESALSRLSEVKARAHLSLPEEDRIAQGIQVAKAVLVLLRKASLNNIQDQGEKSLSDLRLTLENVGFVLDRTFRKNDEVPWEFQEFAQDLTLRLVASQCAKTKNFGWSLIPILVQHARRHRPPVRTITVTNASPGFLNGVYSFTESNGFMRFMRLVPRNAREGAGRQIAIFPIGPYEDGFYFNWVLASKKGQDDEIHCLATSRDNVVLPQVGWRKLSIVSLPTFSCQGYVNPPCKKYNTLEHNLVDWALRNGVIGYFLSESSEAGFDDRVPDVVQLLRLLVSMRERADYLFGEGDSRDMTPKYRLESSLVMRVWELYLNRHTPEGGVGPCSCLASMLHCLPEDIAMPLMEEMQRYLVSDFQTVEAFAVRLVRWAEEVRGEVKYAADLPPSLSDAIQIGLKNLMWRVRTHPDFTFLSRGLDASEDICEMCDRLYKLWLAWECDLGSKRKETSMVDFPVDVPALAEICAPRKPTVTLLDTERRVVQVSMPIKSTSGDYYVGMQVYASLTGSEQGKVLVASIDTDSIEQCLTDSSDTVSLRVCLPENEVWSIKWQGLILRDDIVETPESKDAIVDLTRNDIEERRQKQAEIAAMSELAKQHAGDIQGAVQKLRGSAWSKMDASQKLALLQGPIRRGRATLDDLTCLSEETGFAEASTPGINALTVALSQASDPMAKLERAVKPRDRKSRGKAFKSFISSLLASEDGASWLVSVTADDLANLGGDSNRLFQLLVDDKGSKGDGYLAIFRAASARDDLFSSKQIKKLIDLAGESIPVTQESPIGNEPNDDEYDGKVAAATQVTSSTTKNDPPPQTILKQRDTSNSANPAVPVTPPPRPSSDSTLLTFLKAEASCLKGSPSDFCDWLMTEDITCLEDLADAVTDEEYLQDVLQQGNGTVGVKGFKRNHFNKAVLLAAASATPDEDKENIEYPTELLCPISHVLMTNDPVVASDGHTYERQAIESWIQKQSREIDEACDLIAAGSASLQIQAIVDRGILSPMTNQTLNTLDLFPNKSVRVMARDYADAQQANGKNVGCRKH